MNDDQSAPLPSSQSEALDRYAEAHAGDQHEQPAPSSAYLAQYIFDTLTECNRQRAAELRKEAQ